MRTVIISGGVEGIQRVEFDEEHAKMFLLAVAGDVEAHNATCPNDQRWVWGEEGTDQEPLTPIVPIVGTQEG